MDKDFKDVGSGDDTSECYIITISESRRRIVWCAVLVVCVCGACVALWCVALWAGLLLLLVCMCVVLRPVVCCNVAILRRILEALWRTSAARVGLLVDTYNDAQQRLR